MISLELMGSDLSLLSAAAVAEASGLVEVGSGRRWRTPPLKQEVGRGVCTRFNMFRGREVEVVTL